MYIYSFRVRFGFQVYKLYDQTWELNFDQFIIFF